MVGKLFKITDEPTSKYRSIDDPFDEDKKYFWILLEKINSQYCIIDSSLLDYENSLTTFCVKVDGKQLFEYKSDYTLRCLIFNQGNFEPVSYELNPMSLIMDFLTTYQLMTVNPEYVSF